MLDNLNHGPTYTYGHGGELLTTSDSLSHTTTNQYDSRYRLIQTTDANGDVTQITLDGVGNRTKLIDPDNNSTTWLFDALNRPTSETNALGTTSWTYDASSDVTSITDADGRVRDFSYDNLHRLTAEQWMSGNTVVATMSYAYDPADELTSASDPNSAYAFAYNGDSQVTSVDNSGTPNVPHVVLTSGFDLAGDRTSFSATIAGTADFLNNYVYDGDQRLITLQQQQQTGGNTVAPKEVDFAYNALGQFTSIADYNTFSGPRTDVATGAQTYDAGNRLTGLAYTFGGGAHAIDTFGWGYDAANRVTSFTSNDGTATYGYDPTNQLTSASYTTNTGGNQPANESYSFDANGNRNTSGYSTGSDNLLTSDGTFNYQHDADGNQTVRTRISSSYATDHQTTYSWDYRNRLTDVQYYDNNGVLTKHVHYVYDVFDHLISTEVDPTGSGTYTQIAHYVLDVAPDSPAAGVPGMATAQPALQFDGNGNPTARYLAILDRIFAQGAVTSLTQPDTATWDLVDNLGSDRDIVDNNSNLADHIVYSSFGQVAYESAPSLAHFAGFAGGHTDPTTGLVNDYHRWDDPAVGKWLSQDPLSFDAGDPNLQRYARNAPTDSTDPTGLIDPAYEGPILPPYNNIPPAYVPLFNPPTPKLTPSIGWNYTGGTGPTPAAIVGWNPGVGQPVYNPFTGAYITGSFTSAPNTATTTLIAGGPNVCNTTANGQQGGTLTATLANYPPGTYVVTMTYVVVLHTTNVNGMPVSVTILTPRGATTYNTGPASGPTIVRTRTVSFPVIVPPSGIPAQIVKLRPVMGGAGPGTASFRGTATVVAVTPLILWPGLGGGF